MKLYFQAILNFQKRFNFSINNKNSKNPLLGIQKPNSQDVYIHQTNYNFEEHQQYTHQIKEFINDIAIKEQKLKSSSAVDLLPRRKRRVYDKPKYDTDLKNYGSWRSFDRVLEKPDDHCLDVQSKIYASPKDVIHVFGNGVEAYRNSDATLEYDFEDTNYDCFLIYDYRQTNKNQKKPKNLTDYDPDKESQGQMMRRLQYKELPTKEEFWNSSEKVYFRVNCSRNADFRKFKTWFLHQIQNKQELSYNQKILQKYGEIETFDNYDKNYEIKNEMSVFKYEKSFFGVAKKEIQDSKKEKQQDILTEKPSNFYEKVKPAVSLAEEYRIKKADE